MRLHPIKNTYVDLDGHLNFTLFGLYSRLTQGRNSWGGYWGVLQPPPNLQKNRFLRAKYRYQYISVGKIWKFSLGRTFIATCGPSLVFEFMVFSPSFSQFLSSWENQTETRQATATYIHFLFFVHCSALSSRARQVHFFQPRDAEVESQVLIDSKSIDGK